MDDIAHGTTHAASQKCYRRPEGRCSACKRVSREYMAQYRKNHPEYVNRNGDLVNARGRAAWRLTRMYPDVFRALVAEELAKSDERQDEVA